MSSLYPSTTQVALVSLALKVLLFPAYKSTDFEVHRNWLALTHSLPVRDWYFEATSPWTLDYPPLFAVFEWLMSQFARFIEPSMLNLQALGFESWQTVYFQRCTVLASEFILIYALQTYVKDSLNQLGSHATALSILLSPGLLIIDHIHFQYNGFLYGILIFSLILARKKSTLLHSGLLFATLLCLKHIYLYLAPAYFVYLLRVYCLAPNSIFILRLGHVVRLGTGIIIIFTLTFGPFIYWGQFHQLTSRLFPFSRGLCHAYWAPNFWALYSFSDRILLHLSPILKIKADPAGMQSVTRGRVGDSSFAVLPEVLPATTFLLTLLFQTVSLVKLFLYPNWETFIGTVTLCGYASFLFGWHVHEKAILLVIMPFSLLAVKDRRYLSAFRPLAVAGHLSIFPLLFTAPEYPIKVAYTTLWLIIFLFAFDRVAPVSLQPRRFLLDRLTLGYVIVAICNLIYCSLVHPTIFGEKYEFLPLMLTSSYTALGVIGSWLGFHAMYLAS